MAWPPIIIRIFKIVSTTYFINQMVLPNIYLRSAFYSASACKRCNAYIVFYCLLFTIQHSAISLYGCGIYVSISAVLFVDATSLPVLSLEAYFILPNKHTGICSYTILSTHIKEFSGIQGKHQNVDPSIYHIDLD